MNKNFRTLAILAACLTVGVSASDCNWFEKEPQPNPNPGVETPNEVGPKATVATATEQELAGFNAEGVNLYAFNSNMDINPTNTTVTLETAYKFSVTETVEEATASEYANWIADYYVSVDQNVEAGKIGLAGNYGDWGWIAFYSPIDVETNQQIGLLESTGKTAWTYLDVVTNVGTFYCGAFDLDNACEGVKLTVELRLTNPENAEDTISICVTEYTF